VCVARRATVVVVVDTTVVVVAKLVVVAMPSLADGETTFAIAGSAVVARTTPSINEPIEPIITERRGPRRDVEERVLGSPERFCPCVMLVMDQLSKTQSKTLPTTSQYLLNSELRALEPGRTPWAAGRSTVNGFMDSPAKICVDDDRER
jgi:hypothetical protein